MRTRLVELSIVLLLLTAEVYAVEMGKVTQRIVPLVTRSWAQTAPDNCPLARSADFPRIRFTGRHEAYTNADTWYPSWASDGNLYSPWTDGRIGEERCGSGSGEKARTGQAKIIGDDPLNLQVVSLGTFPGSAKPYGGRYPCGSLVHNGIWYHGSYCLDHRKGPWDIMGPFVGFRTSKDLGKTWTACPLTGARPLFGESGKGDSKVKLGAPHFVDFGRDMEHSPDGKAYLVGHGAVRTEADCSWISGDQAYLVRVKPTPENINDRSKYEFFGGRDGNGNAVWTGDFAGIKPILEWNDHAGCVTMTWNAPLKRYFMCVTHGYKHGGGGQTDYDTYIVESESTTGPWKLVTYLKAFGPQAYFVNIPSKFIGSDGHTMWLCYSANWSRKKEAGNPPGSRYALCLQEFQLQNKTHRTEEASKPADPLIDGVNVAPKATATASTSYPGYEPSGAIDGKVGGYPGVITEEWASNKESKGAWLKLAWDKPQTVDRILLFDRPNQYDYITAGELEFSDGTKISVGELPDDATSGREVRFPARKIMWLKFTVTGVKTGYPHIGLSEIAVFVAGSPAKDE